MMRKWCLLVALFLLCGVMQMVWGAPSSKRASEDKELRAVPAALAETSPLMGAKPNQEAKFYIYLRSANWCGWCNKIAPAIVEEYAKMKKKGVEIIMVSGDKTELEAKNYVKNKHISYPVLWGQGEKLQALPCINRLPGGLPSCVFVDADGNYIASGNGVAVMDWEAICLSAHTKMNMKKKVKGLKPLGKKINLKAQFYVFAWAYSMPEEAQCKEFLQQLREAHKEIRKQHGELVLCIADFSSQMKELYLASKEVFPAVALRYLEGCGGVPGLMYGQNAVVDDKGNVLSNGGNGCVPDWKQALEQANAEPEEGSESKA